jgi:hypothetical protein
VSRDASVSFDWADGYYTFRLAWGELIELQEKCDAGPFVIFKRFMDNTWKAQDISETLRLGLIGGGMEVAKARILVQRYVQKEPLLQNVIHAQAVLGAAIFGVDEEEIVKKSEETTTSPSPTERSEFQPSTEAVQ